MNFELVVASITGEVSINITRPSSEDDGPEVLRTSAELDILVDTSSIWVNKVE